MEENNQQELKAEAEASATASIHGDVLEIILSHVPLIDLEHARCVSNTWNRAVFSSLRHLNPIKPWLIVHKQSTRHPYATTAHAYDPRSGVWLKIDQPPINHVSALRSSHSTLLYMQTSLQFAFSFDPLHLKWNRANAPLVWRTDPIVALVGHRVVVAGGTFDLGDDPLPLETYDLRTGKWDICQWIPTVLKDSPSSLWLSVAVDEHKMYVTEKSSGITHSFDPSTKTWYGPYDLRPGNHVFSSAIGFVNDSMVVVGLIGDSENVKGVKLWEAMKGTEMVELREIGEMPEELVGKLKGESACLPSIGLNTMGQFAYLHNPSDPGELILCEVADGACRWGSVRNVVGDDESRMQRLVFTCSDVGLGVLHDAICSGNRRFTVEDNIVD
ncbi:hypothetical protein F2P56_037041 [Juglans regia]|uniref:F-box/kelch-repeat protein At1g23390-like n=2 Tax=Juglans regia TaxID=51240 RepID=A0A6P9E607_JUGRE|nr:F-box/kelch-repeat protein At1g23390-like [Juglans regia]KAF5442085.1 hypothetical protein F2P56_037041 [Juglans regia]